MKIGVLGIGSIGSRHARNLLHMGHAVVAWDPKPGHGHKPMLVNVWGGRWAKDEDAIYEDPEIKAVLIASPTPSHLSHMLKAIDAKKHIFVEKPIALANVQATAEAVEAAKAANLVLAVGYMLRFHPAVVEAKRYIDGNKLGALRWGSLVCAQYSNRYGEDDLLMHWASHEVDLAQYLFGAAAVRYLVAGKSGDSVDTADIILSHGRIISHVHSDTVAKTWLRYTHVVGENGAMELDLIGHAFTPPNYNKQQFSHNGDDDVWDLVYQAEMQAFIDRVETGIVTGPLATGDDGLSVLKLLRGSE